MGTRLADGTELHLIDRGTGMPVVLVHGFPLDGSMWDTQIEPLAARHRVLVPDLRGFGRRVFGIPEETQGHDQVDLPAQQHRGRTAPLARRVDHQLMAVRFDDPAGRGDRLDQVRVVPVHAH